MSNTSSSISHFLALSLIILLVFIPQVSICISSRNWNLLPFRYILNLSCNVRSLLCILPKAALLICLYDLFMNLWLFCAVNLQQKFRLNMFVLVWTGSLACMNLSVWLQPTFVRLSAYTMLQSWCTGSSSKLSGWSIPCAFSLLLLKVKLPLLKRAMPWGYSYQKQSLFCMVFQRGRRLPSSQEDSLLHRESNFCVL